MGWRLQDPSNPNHSTIAMNHTESTADASLLRELWWSQVSPVSSPLALPQEPMNTNLLLLLAGAQNWSVASSPDIKVNSRWHPCSSWVLDGAGAPGTSRKPTRGKTHLKKGRGRYKGGAASPGNEIFFFFRHLSTHTWEPQGNWEDLGTFPWVDMGIFCPKNHSGTKTPFPRTQQMKHPTPAKEGKKMSSRNPGGTIINFFFFYLHHKNNKLS